MNINSALFRLFRRLLQNDDTNGAAKCPKLRICIGAITPVCTVSIVIIVIQNANPFWQHLYQANQERWPLSH